MPVPQKLNVRKALQARMKGVSYGDIAKQQGVSKTTVVTTVAPLLKQLPDAGQLAEMKATLADHFVATAYATVASISTEDMAKATLQQKATAAGILLDKHRLMTGQTTQNQGLAVYFKAVVESVPVVKTVAGEVIEVEKVEG